MNRTPLKRNKEMRRSRIKRKRKSQRERDDYIAKHYGSRDRLLRIKRTPCCVCGNLPSENHHTETAGMGLKGSWKTIAPLCRDHHEVYHRIGYYQFSNRYGVDVREVAARLAEEELP